MINMHDFRESEHISRKIHGLMEEGRAGNLICTGQVGTLRLGGRFLGKLTRIGDLSECGISRLNLVPKGVEHLLM